MEFLGNIMQFLKNNKKFPIYCSLTCTRKKIENFKSRPEFNNYLKNYSDTRAVLYYIFDRKSRDLMAYFSLAATSVVDSTGSVAIPAIELKMFALNDKYTRKENPESIASYICMNLIIELAMRYASEYIGATFLILYCLPKLVDMYKRNGFELIPKKYNVFEKERYGKEFVAMRRTLFKNK